MLCVLFPYSEHLKLSDEMFSCGQVGREVRRRAFLDPEHEAFVLNRPLGVWVSVADSHDTSCDRNSSFTGKKLHLFEHPAASDCAFAVALDQFAGTLYHLNGGLASQTCWKCGSKFFMRASGVHTNIQESRDKPQSQSP